jgi:hypothetical protein
MLKQLFTSFLAILWLSVANHCYLGSAFAAPVKAAHHCGGSGEKSAPTSSHDGCPKKVCCESFSPMTTELQLVSVFPTLNLLPILLTSFPIPDSTPAASAQSAGMPPSLGPPGHTPSLLLSLTLAQNAPPSARAA